PSQSSEVGNELQSPEVGEVSLVEKLGWDGGLDGGDDLEIAAAADDEKRAFHAMRGKKDDPSLDWDEADKRAFHAMRGKRLLAPASVLQAKNIQGPPLWRLGGEGPFCPKLSRGRTTRRFPKPCAASKEGRSRN
ncbi:unnamed protein product, partial [Ixodes persulcatus]